MASNEPITGDFSRINSFDLDGDGSTSEDELRVFNALNADPDEFLTFRDADLVQRDYTPARQQAVERMLGASAGFRQRYDEGLRDHPMWLFANASNRRKAEASARLAHAFAPPNSDQQRRAAVILQGLRAAPAKQIVP